MPSKDGYHPLPQVEPLKFVGNKASLRDFAQGTAEHRATRVRRKADEMVSSARTALRAAQQAMDTAETVRAYALFQEMQRTGQSPIHWAPVKPGEPLPVGVETACGVEVRTVAGLWAFTWESEEVTCPLCLISSEFLAAFPDRGKE